MKSAYSVLSLSLIIFGDITYGIYYESVLDEITVTLQYIPPGMCCRPVIIYNQ